jgi:drug/metabolite transporter (DMT)-like permease
MSQITKDTKGSLYAIVSGFLYGFIGYFGIRALNDNFSITTMLFWRFFVSTLVIGSLLFYNRKEIQANISEVIKAFIYGALFYGGSAITYFMASDYIGTGLSMVIVFTYPIFVLLSNAIFDNHKITKLYYISVSIIMIGMILLVSTEDMHFNFYGAFLALICALTYAGYVFLSKKQMTRLDPLTSSLIVSLANTIVFFIMAKSSNTFSIPTNLNSWINVIAIGLICTALPILFLLESMKYISSEKASLLSVLEPICVVVIGVYLLNEHLFFIQIIGIILILGAALLVQLEKLKVIK